MRARVGGRAELRPGARHLVGRIALQLLLGHSLTGAAKRARTHGPSIDPVPLDVPLPRDVALGRADNLLHEGVVERLVGLRVVSPRRSSKRGDALPQGPFCRLQHWAVGSDALNPHLKGFALRVRERHDLRTRNAALDLLDRLTTYVETGFALRIQLVDRLALGIHDGSSVKRRRGCDTRRLPGGWVDTVDV